tara:strand:- start:64 stop:234 length:171 start_codon:yes stop_codon:yes gene_type:complete
MREKFEEQQKKAFQKELGLNGILEFFELKEAIKDYDSRNNRLQNTKKDNPKTIEAV